jgi:malate dehydrogenase (oxaloacetate-decarboxylating)
MVANRRPCTDQFFPQKPFGPHRLRCGPFFIFKMIYYRLFFRYHHFMSSKKTAPKKNIATPSKKKDYAKMALALHKKLHGKIEMVSKGKLTTRDEWSTMYTPGVGAVSSHLAKFPREAREYTMKRNTVAVISDGSAVLGLGNIGPIAAMPVMEGKCAILKEMAGIDGIPLVLDVHGIDEIVAVVKAVAPTFGAINLEDIAAPQCFEIEEKLKAALDIPVMHDDQHGTAIVVLAGLMNAAKVVKKNLTSLRVVIVGAGAAGRAIALLLLKAGVTDVILTDSKGVIYKGRGGMVKYKEELAKITNPRHVKGELLEAVKGADAVVGVSGPGTIAKMHVEAMAEDAIVFGLANPIPEIMPHDAYAAGARVVATGRSDFPNQINNSLAFPGIFRGALDKRITKITDEIKLEAAKKLASMVKKPTPEKIIPGVMEPGLMKRVASAVR